MRKLLRILGWFFLVVLVIAGIGYVWLTQQYPDYRGEEKLHGLFAEVEVYHDEFGVPHIYASSKLDAYQALGYITARERFFQMELARRLGGGRLSEIFGDAALETDLLFRSMLPDSLIKSSALQHIHHAPAEIKDEVLAYLDGVNAYVASDDIPLEFRALGIEKQEFTAEDMYRIAGYLAYGFSLGGRTDPVVNDVINKLGPEYLSGLGITQDSTQLFNPSFPTDSAAIAFEAISAHLTRALEAAPVPKLVGSNSWVVSGAKTTSGLPILCNDTHIGFGIPQVWFEAHIECDEFSFYGNFLPGIPYGLVGHNRQMAWGVTMLENDDMDLFIERIDENNPDHYLVDSVAIPFRKDTLRFGRKDLPDTSIAVRSTHRGPLMNGIFSNLNPDHPVSCRWDYTHTPNFLVEAFRSLNRCEKMAEANQALSRVASPGLNVTYADKAGNIAWWAVAKFQLRPDHVFSKAFIDGSTRRNDPLGYSTWDKNPKSINPDLNFVSTANDQPQSPDGSFEPGYYKPSHRAERIGSILASRDDWDAEGMKALITDVTCDRDAELAKGLAHVISGAEGIESTDLELLDWDGRHEVDDISPTFFYKFLYRILDNTMADEMGQDWLTSFLGTHWHGRAYPLLLIDDNSPWWDDVRTTSIESRKDIFTKSFTESIQQLEDQLGKDRSSWNWGRVHTLKLAHPFAQGSDAMGKVFNIQEQPFRGGHETIAQAGFSLNSEGLYPARYGAQMRIIVDMADIENSVSITPSGQSGHRYSPHYSDQAEAYRLGGFRRQDMMSSRIKQSKNVLVLTPNY